MASKIQHVVIVVQENRSFNDLFYGFPGAKTVKYGYDTGNKKIELKPIPVGDAMGCGTLCGWILLFVQRHGQHSRHGLPNERFQ